MISFILITMNRFKTFARFSGIMAMLVEYVAILYFVLTTGIALRLDQPISYFSTLPSTKSIFGSAFVLAALLAGVFGYWLYEQYHLDKTFGVVYALMLVSQVIFAIIPDSGSWQVIHLFAALLVGFLMPLVIYMFTKQAQPVRYKRIMIGCFYFQVIAFATLIITMGRFILINEVILGVAFHLWAVLATFDLPSRA